jgi:hypothetical protein
MKIAGSESGSESGSISQMHGSADPDLDPHKNVMDPQHCREPHIISVFGPESASFDNLESASPLITQM